MFEALRTAVDMARAKGIEVLPGKYGVIDVYDSLLAVIWVRDERTQGVCPLGAAALALPKRPSTMKLRQRNLTTLQALAHVLAVPPDYVHGFTHGFDGNQKWGGIEYGMDWDVGFSDATRMLAHLRGELE